MNRENVDRVHVAATRKLMMRLDPRGLEAAIAAVADSEGWNVDDMPITIQTATSAISAYLTAIGETHVLVPKEPTPEMREAFWKAHEEFEDGGFDGPDHQWNAMLSAAKEGEGRDSEPPLGSSVFGSKGGSQIE